MKDLKMPLVQIRPKRQLTVPKEIFDKLDLHEGDYLEAIAENDRIVLVIKDVQDRAQKRYSMQDLIGAVKGVYGSVEEIDRTIAEGREDREYPFK